MKAETYWHLIYTYQDESNEKQTCAEILASTLIDDPPTGDLVSILGILDDYSISSLGLLARVYSRDLDVEDEIINIRLEPIEIKTKIDKHLRKDDDVEDARKEIVEMYKRINTLRGLWRTHLSFAGVLAQKESTS